MVFQLMTAPPSFGRQTFGLWGSSDGKPVLSDGSLDIDAFLDSMLMRDPIGLGTELVPPSLAQGLGLATDAYQAQQGSNGRKQGSGNRLQAILARPGAPTPTTLGVSGSVPQSAAGQKAPAGQPAPAEEALRGNGEADGAPEGAENNNTELEGGHRGNRVLASELALAQKQAAAAGAAAAQAAYAQQQQQAATAMAAAAQAYSQQQAVYAQQTQQAATAAAAAAAAASQPAGHSQRHQYMHTAHQAQAQAQAQQAAYFQAYQQQAAAHHAQAQAAAYMAATGQYPPGWMPSPYGYPQQQQYYNPQQQYLQYSSSQYQGMPAGGMASLPPASGMPPSALPPPPPQPAPASRLVEGGDGAEDGDEAHAVKRPRLIWTKALHKRFLESVDKCGGLDHALPKAIMMHMDVSGLTRENVASHLQKYRMRLKKAEEHGGDDMMDGLEDGDHHGLDGKEERDGREGTPVQNNNGVGGGENGGAAGRQKQTAGGKRKVFEIAQEANNSHGGAL